MRNTEAMMETSLPTSMSLACQIRYFTDVLLAISQVTAFSSQYVESPR